MTLYDIEEITVPSTLDAPDAGPFLEMCAIKNALEEEGYGTDELSYEPAEILPNWKRTDSPIRGFGVRVDGALVGRAVYTINVDDATGTVWLHGGVLQQYRRRGIGTALYEHVESLALAEGKSKLIVYAVSRDNDGERLFSPTGFGSVSLDNPEVQFLLDNGFSLEQVERGSRLALPVDLDDQLATLQPDGYRVHQWSGRVPEKWLADVAHLYTRMSTDAPSAGLEEPEDVWTADRLRADEDRLADSPRTNFTSVVEHVASGTLVGFTVLSAPAELHRPISQEDTLVLSEHRGHALGMLLKVANLVHVQRERPGHPGVLTFNAEENRHMLNVNEAVGFVPIGYEGGWKKLL